MCGCVDLRLASVGYQLFGISDESAEKAVVSTCGAYLVELHELDRNGVL